MARKGEAERRGGGWRLERSAFARLLEALHRDPTAASREYERLRQRLMRFFALQGIARREEAADEAFNRLAKRLSEGEDVRNVESYLAGIARLLTLEERQRTQREREAMRRLTETEPDTGDDESMLQALDQCLLELPEESRQLLRRYYASDGGRRVREREALARELGLSPNTLRNRILRLRQKLEQAFRARLEGGAPRDAGGANDTSSREED